MKKISQSIYVKAGLFFAVIVLCAVYTYCRTTRIQIDSDFANLVLEADDIVSGNFFRKGWILTGVSFLTTDLPFFCIGVLIAGVSVKAYYIACTLMQLLLDLAAFLLIKDRVRGNRLIAAFIFSVMVCMPNLFEIYILSAHTGVFIISFFCIYLLNRQLNSTSGLAGQTRVFQRSSEIKNYLLYEILLILGMAGDPLVLLVVVLPVCLYVLVAWCQRRYTTRYSVLLLLEQAVGVISGFLLDKIYFLFGSNKNSFFSEQSFIELDSLGEKAILYLKSILLMVDADFPGKPLTTIHTLYYFVNVLTLIAFCSIVVLNIIRLLRDEEYDFISVILSIGFLTTSLIFLITTVSADVRCARYFGYLPAFMAVALIRNLQLFFGPATTGGADIDCKMNEAGQTGLYCRRKAVAVCVLLVLFAGKAYRISKTADNFELYPMLDPDRNNLLEVLKSNDLTDGYASFWNASSLTVSSRQKNKVRAVHYLEAGVIPHLWFCKPEWYNKKANFIITEEDDEWLGITYDRIKSFLGDPDRVIEAGKYKIMIYDHAIDWYFSRHILDNAIHACEWYKLNEMAYMKKDAVQVEMGGKLYGPYCQADAGRYAVICKGENLGGLSVQVQSVSQEKIYLEKEEIGEDNMFFFELPEAVNDLEVVVTNEAEESALIRKFVVEKQTDS